MSTYNSEVFNGILSNAFAFEYTVHFILFCLCTSNINAILSSARNCAMCVGLKIVQ